MRLQTALDQMVNAQMLRRLNPMDDTRLGDGYAFKHGLTQDAALRSLSRRQRELIHRRVAACYETLFAARLDEYAAVLAFHYDEAGDNQKALDYSLRAGEAAMNVYATAEAGQQFDRALRIVQRNGPATSEQLVKLFTRRGRALELESRFDDALENYRLQEQLAQARSDRVLELAAIVKQTKLYSFINHLYDPVAGRALAERALVVAETLDDRRSEAEIYWNMMNQARFDIGRLAEAIVFGERALEIAARSAGPSRLPTSSTILPTSTATWGAWRRAPQICKRQALFGASLATKPCWQTAWATLACGVCCKATTPVPSRSMMRPLRSRSASRTSGGRHTARAVAAFLAGTGGSTRRQLQTLRRALR